MRASRVAFTSSVFVLMLASIGCSHNNYYPTPPPPPAMQVPPVVQLGNRNGFLTGRSDGVRDATSGFAFAPRRTRAFHDTPGYDPALGPFGVYRNAFRDAYVRGYGEGYNHR